MEQTSETGGRSSRSRLDLKELTLEKAIMLLIAGVAAAVIAFNILQSSGYL